MSDTPAPLSGASTSTPRRSFLPWILGLLVVAALGGATFWLVDGPNRYHAAQEMRAGRMALLASDLPGALGHFRAAAILRPTDEAVILQYDQTQSRWVALVEQQLQKLEPAGAYLAWQKLPPTEGELVEPHASRYHEIKARIEEHARTVAQGYIADARTHWEQAEFAPAYELLHQAEPLAALVPELPAQLRKAQAAEVAHAMAAAREAMDAGDYAGARADLKTVAALGAGNAEYLKMGPAIDEAELANTLAGANQAMTQEKFDEAREIWKTAAALGAGNADYVKMGPAIDEAEVHAALRDAGAAIEKQEYKSATERLARAAELKVLPEEVTAAQAKLREGAGIAATTDLARAIAADDSAKATAALELGRLYAGWEAMPAENLLQPADLPSFLKALEVFKLGKEGQGAYTNRLDIPLVMYSRRKFPEEAVTEYLREGFRDWSRRAEQFKLLGLALYLDAQAQECGAPVDEAWRRETTRKAIESAHVAVAVADPVEDSDAPSGLNAAATAALRQALQAKLGEWPKLVPNDPAHPPTVVLTGRFAGFDTNDNPDVETRTVRYQSGTRQVANQERNRIIDEHNEVMDRRNQLNRSINDNQYKVDRLNSGEQLNDWERSEGIGAAGALVVQRYQLQKLEAEIRDLRAQGDAMPQTVSEPVYANEEYQVIDHHYTGTLAWQLDANMHGQEATVAEWSADTEFQTREVTGNANRGVPVKEPEPVPYDSMAAGLVGKVVARVGDVDEVVDKLPLMTMNAFIAFFEKNKAQGVGLANEYLALAYAWEDVGRALPADTKDTVLSFARQQINLPP